jgi:DNA-binding MarR family transcriptional regulator
MMSIVVIYRAAAFSGTPWTFGKGAGCIYNAPMSSFEQEMRAIVDTCAATRLRTLTRFVSGIYDELLRPLDLKVSQLNILVLLATLQSARPGQLCELLCLDSSTLSRNIDRMRARGWLDLVQDVGDARAHSVQLTDHGRELLRKALPLWKKGQEKVEDAMGKPTLEAIRKSSKGIVPGL